VRKIQLVGRKLHSVWAQ